MAKPPEKRGPGSSEPVLKVGESDVGAPSCDRLPGLRSWRLLWLVFSQPGLH